MPIRHTNFIPRELPFYANSFRWDDFERFCAMWLVSGTTLPNLTLDGHEGPGRLKVVDAHRVGTSGEKQHGIDILVTMENRATWVVQCKHMAKFGKTDAAKAIEKAKREFGSHQPAHYLIWVTGKVTADATLVAHQAESVTLWSAGKTHHGRGFTHPAGAVWPIDPRLLWPGVRLRHFFRLAIIFCSQRRSFSPAGNRPTGASIIRRRWPGEPRICGIS